MKEIFISIFYTNLWITVHLDDEAPPCTLLIEKYRNCKGFKIEFLELKLCQLSHLMLTMNGASLHDSSTFMAQEFIHVLVFQFIKSSDSLNWSQNNTFFLSWTQRSFQKKGSSINLIYFRKKIFSKFIHAKSISKIHCITNILLCFIGKKDIKWDCGKNFSAPLSSKKIFLDSEFASTRACLPHKNWLSQFHSSPMKSQEKKRGKWRKGKWFPFCKINLKKYLKQKIGKYLCLHSGSLGLIELHSDGN